MKTVMLISSSGARYFRRDQGLWRLIEKPDHEDRLWVIANLPEETLEAFKLPLLFGRDRSAFLQRRLLAAFPHSEYRAAPVISGSLFKPGSAVITGLTTMETVTSRLGKQDAPVAGVWGMAMLLTLMLRRLAIDNAMLAIPSERHLRILIIKEGIPVITRCVHRYSEDSDQENNSDTNEILRTRQHLENRRIFEHDALPPLLYLGDTSLVGAHFNRAGLTLLPLPDALSPRGDAAYLHPLFELVASSPAGQFAPLQLRARHLAENLRRVAFAGIAASLIVLILFGQEDFSTLIDLHAREQTLKADLQQTTRERDRLAGRISASGTDPARVRQATKFAALEMIAAPTPESILQFAATIADLPQVRIKSLTFRFPKQGERYCQGHTVIDMPLISRKFDLPLNRGGTPADSGTPQRYTELQFTILLTENLPAAAQTDIRKRISTRLKNREGVQLMQDPSAFSLINTLKGGFGTDTPQTENLWCMSIPWSATSAPLSPDSPPETPSPQSSGVTSSHSTKPLINDGKVAGYPASGRGSERGRQSLIPAVERVRASLREHNVKGLP